MDTTEKRVILKFTSLAEAEAAATAISDFNNDSLEISDVRFKPSMGAVEAALLIEFTATVLIPVGCGILSNMIFELLKKRRNPKNPDAPYTLFVDGFEVKCQSKEDLYRLLQTAEEPPAPSAVPTAEEGSSE